MGSHCFPLSPSQKLKFDSDGLPEPGNDILQSVFDVLGAPSKADTSFISDEQAFGYVKKFEKRKPANLQ